MYNDTMAFLDESAERHVKEIHPQQERKYLQNIASQHVIPALYSTISTQVMVRYQSGIS